MLRFSKTPIKLAIRRLSVSVKFTDQQGKNIKNSEWFRKWSIEQALLGHISPCPWGKTLKKEILRGVEQDCLNYRSGGGGPDRAHWGGPAANITTEWILPRNKRGRFFDNGRLSHSRYRPKLLSIDVQELKKNKKTIKNGLRRDSKKTTVATRSGLDKTHIKKQELHVWGRERGYLSLSWQVLNDQHSTTLVGNY